MIKYTYLILIALLYFSCEQSKQKIDTNSKDFVNLDEKILISYIKAITLLESEQRGLLSRLNSGEELNKPQKEALESILKSNFDYPSQFEDVNRKISIIYLSLLKGKDDEKAKAKKMDEHKINKTEYELVQKYLQELAEALQDVKFTDGSKSK